MDTVENPQVEPPKPKYSRKTKTLLTGFAALILVIIMLMAGGVYFAFTTIRSSALATSFNLPIFEAEPVSNQIAFVGPDTNMWLVAPDGSNARRLTTDARGYRFPTWSPDGRQLAFIGRNDSNQSALFISPTNNGEPSMVFSNPTAAPFYLYWAPNSQSITFLAQEDAGMSMRQIDTAMPENNRVIAEGAPFYWAWSPNSEKMLMHVGGAREISENAHLSIMENQSGSERVELNLAPGQFQAPAWSSNGEFFVYIAQNEETGDTIYKTNADTLEQQIVTQPDRFAFLTLSPQNDKLAFLQLEPGIKAPFGKAWLIDVTGENKKLLMESPVASMYWSPDGKKLALLSLGQSNDGESAKAGALAAPLPQGLTLRWWVYDVETDTLEPVVSFTPTNAFLQTVPYFDQYYLSLTFWSPDSRYLVVTKAENEKMGQGSIWVVDTSGKDDPVKVGDGSLAVWSWQ